MAYNIKNMIKASFLIIIIGVVLIVLAVILRLLSLLITDSNPIAMDITPVDIIRFLSTGYGFLVILLFTGLYLWAGFRAVNKYKLDAVGAGGVSALSYFVIGLVHLFLTTLLNILVVSHVVGGIGFGSAEAILAAYLFGDISGTVGIGLSVVCGIGLLLFGTMIAFVIGGAGGLFALSRRTRRG